MCTEREQLIGYVYDDCDADERKRIDAHLVSCDECRDEVTGLRRTRQDLLAWDVPAHGSVWRPFAPAPVVFRWHDVPAWAMAAAAGIILLAGAAGGVVTETLLARGQRTAAVAAAAPNMPAPAVTAADLAALETRMLATVRSEVDERVRAVSAHDVAPRAVRASADDDLANQVKALRTDQVDLAMSVVSDMAGVNNRMSKMERALPTAYAVPVSLR